MWQQEPSPQSLAPEAECPALGQGLGLQEARSGPLDLHAQGRGRRGGAASKDWCGISPCHSRVPSAMDVKRKTSLCFRVKAVVFLTRVFGWEAGDRTHTEAPGTRCALLGARRACPGLNTPAGEQAWLGLWLLCGAPLPFVGTFPVAPGKATSPLCPVEVHGRAKFPRRALGSEYCVHRRQAA